MVRSRSYIATPPGATIKEQLNDRGMSQKEFSVRMDMSEKHISRLINGDVQLTPETAERLELVLGVPARFWNNLEGIYREKLLKIKAEESMDTDSEIVKLFPYNEMAKYGWVPKTSDTKERVVNLRKYFEVVDLSLLGDEQITKIACRRLGITEKSDLALMAWAQEAKIIARDIQTLPLDTKGLTSIVPEFKKMTLLQPAEFCPEMKKMLAYYGIALVFIPHLKGSFLQGASFYDGNKIVMGLTNRGRDTDKFWFSFFHELAHIVLGHISKTGGLTKSDEDVADRWSRDELISKSDYDRFKRMSDYSKKSILLFAQNQGIAPGIVVGRMQKDHLIEHNLMNDLKEQIDIEIMIKDN